MVDYHGGPVVKNPPANAGDMGLTPGPKDSTCHRATKPVCHNHWASTLEPESGTHWAHVLPTTEAGTATACALQQEKPTDHS